jgi:hypothetical protein
MWSTLKFDHSTKEANFKDSGSQAADNVQDSLQSISQYSVSSASLAAILIL